MDVDVNQLRAFDAAVTEGSLDAAARRLHVTPSAVSQRLKALESTVGQVLLVRSRPVRVTPAGQVVLRLARQLALLTADASTELGSGAATSPGPSLPIAVNADSLATWVLPALAPLADRVRLDLRREDEEHTSEMLRDGTVMAAVTTQARAVSGCRVSTLGVMRYRAMAAPGFARRWFPDGVHAEELGRAPVVVFDRNDDLQHHYLRRAGARLDPPAHYVPASTDFHAAVRLGIGWGMMPDLQSGPDRRAGDLVDLAPDEVVDRVLHWQQWRLRSDGLDQVADAVVAAAREHLLPS